MPFLVSGDNSWSVPIPSDLVRVSVYLTILVEDDDNGIVCDDRRFDVLVGSPTDSVETQLAVRGLQVLVELSEVIRQFNNPAEGSTLYGIRLLKEKIVELYDEWVGVKDNPVYFWLYPNQEMTKVVLEYHRGEGAAAQFKTPGDIPSRTRGGEREDITMNQVFTDACAKGNIVIAKWLYKLGEGGGEGEFDIHTRDDEAFRCAYENGYLEVMKWLYSLGGFDIGMHGDILIRQALLADKTGLIHCLYELDETAFCRRIHEWFAIACYRGYEPLAHWLYGTGKVRIHSVNVEVFTSVCELGRERIARWIHGFGGLDIHARYDEAFRGACRNGHEAIARWIHGMGGVDIHAMNDGAFRGACESGHEGIVRWLYGLGGVDIQAQGDVFVRVAAFAGHEGIVEFLREVSVR